MRVLVIPQVIHQGVILVGLAAVIGGGSAQQQRRMRLECYRLVENYGRFRCRRPMMIMLLQIVQRYCSPLRRRLLVKDSCAIIAHGVLAVCVLRPR